MEIWKDIEGYEDSYQVSNLGRVRSKDRYTKTWNGKVFKKGVIKTTKEDKDGYLRVWLSKESKKKPFFIHRLVATTFHENKENLPVVNHLDGNIKNNKEDNLEWCTRSENDKHAFKLGLRKVSCGGTSKKVVKKCPLTGSVLKEYKSMSEAAKDLDGTIQNISLAVKNNHKAYGFVWEVIK